jgi:hypothetical protein
MIALVTAHFTEARPFIERWSLTHNPSLKPFDLYTGDKANIIISGVGKTRCLVATSCLLSYTQNLPNLTVANIGCAGAKLEYPIGDLFLITKVTDYSTKRTFYSDPLYNHDLPEVALATFETPVTEAELSDPDFDLVDTEASGFLEAGGFFVNPNQLSVLKIVSDHLESSIPTAEYIETLVGKHLGTVERYLSAPATP